LWRLLHNTAQPDFLAADEAYLVDALIRLVTTGNELVAHADSFHTR
jgi:hypothetical protein